eukprot:6437254-Pyramimonas_sp.AAC.1
MVVCDRPRVRRDGAPSFDLAMCPWLGPGDGVNPRWSSDHGAPGAGFEFIDAMLSQAPSKYTLP